MSRRLNLFALAAHMLALGHELPLRLEPFRPRISRRKPNRYIPGGAHRNVEGTPIRNPKVAANVNAMYEKWHAAKLMR